MSDGKHFFCKAFQNLNFIATWCINSDKYLVKNDFPFHFKKIIFHYKKIGYNIYALRQTAYLVVYPIKVKNFTSLIARR